MSDLKGDHVDILLVGAETRNPLPDYHNISSFCHDSTERMQNPSVKMIQFLKEPFVGAGDVMDALIIAIDSINEHVKHYKYSRHIYLFTDASNTIQMDDFDVVKDQIISKDIRYVLCGFDFGTSSPTSQKALNEQFLMQFVANDNCDFYPGDEAFKQALKPLKKNTKPRTLFRGDLILGHLEIPIWIYPKTMEAKLPTAKKWSLLADRVPPAIRDETFGQVLAQKAYTVVKDEDEIEVDAQDTIMAHRYGKSLIPYDEQDSLAGKMSTVKEMQCLGFIQQSKIPRHYFMGNVAAVVGSETDTQAQQRITALAAAMYEVNAAAIVRYCRITDAEPKMGALIYNPKGYLYFVQLPYENDKRHFKFQDLEFLTRDNVQTSPRKKSKLDTRTGSSRAAAEAIDNLINAMDLDNLYSNLISRPAYEPKNMYNQAISNLYANLCKKVLGDRAISISNDLEPAKVEESISSAISNCFHIVKTAAIEKGNLFQQEEEEVSEARHLINPFQVGVTSISTVNPVEDLEAMIKTDENLATQAFAQMGQVIEQLVQESFGTSLYPKALECVKSLRKHCILLDFKSYNSWLTNFKQISKADFWGLLSEAESLISKKEVAQSDVHVQQSHQFIQKTAPTLVEDEPDLLSLLD